MRLLKLKDVLIRAEGMFSGSYSWSAATGALALRLGRCLVVGGAGRDIVKMLVIKD